MRYEDKTFDEERALYGAKDIEVIRCRFDGPADGESAMKEGSDIRVSDSLFNLRYPFWHAKNTIIRNSHIKGEYLAWYCENVTFENCTIIGTQPLCYCRNLKLINCRMLNADLAFERSDVKAKITNEIISIKNPRSGTINVKGVGEIIMDDKDARGKVIIGE